MDKIIIFGAGNTGVRAYEQIYKNCHILCFLDNNEKEWGKQLKDISVKQPTLENINALPFDYILIASVFGKQAIEKQLLDLGVEPEKIRHIQQNYDVLSPFLKNLAEVFQTEGIEGSIAEVGVFQGESAEKLNKYFPDKMLHLFDTFTGFDEEDVKTELKHSFSNARTSQYNDTSIDLVMQRMAYPKTVVIHKGYFPNTAIGINDRFCFVRIDMDLYTPTAAALDFFHGKISHKGCILIHDYFGESYKGIKRAVNEYLNKYPQLYKIPIGDMLSIAIVGY